MDQIVGHMRQGVVLPDPGSFKLEERPVNHKLGHSQAYVISEGKMVPEMAAFGKGQHYNITGLFHDERGYPSTNPEICEKLMRRVIDKVELDKDNIMTWEEIDTDDAEIVVISYGGLAACAEAAVADARAKGIKAGLFRPITIWPFPGEKVLALSKKAKQIIVCELNGGQLLLEIERVVKGNCPIDFMGRLNGSVIEPDEILARIEEVAKW
jgi:2-oxoglutarate ferredoxin oxidoreductase subunit alpha